MRLGTGFMAGSLGRMDKPGFVTTPTPSSAREESRSYLAFGENNPQYWYPMMNPPMIPAMRKQKSWRSPCPVFIYGSLGGLPASVANLPTTASSNSPPRPEGLLGSRKKTRGRA